MANNPFLDSVNARDDYIASYTDPTYSPSKQKTSSGNPFLDAINSSSNSRQLTKKQQSDAEKKKKLDELAQIEQSAPKQKNLLDIAGEGLAGIGNAIAAPFKHTGEGVAEVLGEVTGQNQKIRDAQQQQMQQQIEQIRIAGQKIRDPNISSQEKARWQKVLSDNASNDSPFTEAQAYNTQQAEKVDPIKGGAAVGELGLNILSGGANGILKGAVAGAGFGALSAAEEKGKNTTFGDVAQSAATGAVLGGAIPAVGKAVKGIANKLRPGETPPVPTSTDEVVQVVNPTTKEKTFYRIPADQRDQIVNSIDGSENGIAGKNINGEVTHVTARTPEQMSKKGFKDGGVYGQEESQVGQAVKNVATPEGQVATEAGTGQSRYASKTLKNSEFVGINDDALGATYQKTTNAQRADNSLKALDTEGLDQFSDRVYNNVKNTKKGKINDQDVFDAQAAAQALEEKGGDANLQKAADIYNELSTHLTEAGKTVQAASIMARRTPQGLRFYAQKQFDKAGVDLTPSLQKELNGLIDAVKTAKPQSNEAAIARDNVMYFIGKNMPSSTKDKVIGFWRAGLLTSPTTPLGAVVGNAAMTAERKLFVNPVATFADIVQSVFTGKRTQTLAKAGEFGQGAKQGTKNALSEQYRKTGFDPQTELNKSGKYDTPRAGINYGDGRLGRATGAYVNGVYKLMGGLDQPFRYGAEREALSSIANAEVKNQGLKGQAAKDFYNNFMENPPQEALQRANTEGLRETFQDETKLGNAAASLSKNLGGVGEVIVPFTRVPASVATRIIDHTPIGTARTMGREILSAVKGNGYDQRAVSRAIGEGTLSVPILGVGYALAQNGEITGGYPSTKEERDQWQREGKQPNSVKIGDKWYSLNYIQPFGAIMAIGAGINDAVKSGADTGTIVGQALSSGGNSILGQSFLQGMQQLTDALQNPAQYGGKYLSNLAGSVVPNFIRAGVRAGDPIQRETNDVSQGILGSIPGLRDQLPAKLDSEGNPLPAKGNFIDQFANPLKPSNVRNDSDAKFYNDAINPASKLKSRRTTEINDLLSRGSVNTAQRKIDEYNQQVAGILAPYIKENKGSITDDQLKRIDDLFLGNVWINSKGRPYISSRTDLPN